MSRLSSFVNRLRYGPAAMDELKRASLGLAKGIHVGAHLGEELETYQNMGFSSMLWIEASPEQFAKLKERIEGVRPNGMKNVAVNAFASESDGEALHLRRFNNEGASSSIFAATPLLTKTWRGLADTGTSEEVITATLDRISSEHGFADADFLNVDVQGAELLVLKGATAVLASVKAVIAEVSTKPYYDGGVLWPQLRDYLREHGFEALHQKPRPHDDMLFLRK